MLRGQIEGAIAQAHGYTLSEQLVVENGRIQNPRLSQYLILESEMFQARWTV